MYSSTHSATYISIYSSIYSSGKVLELCMSKIPQPPGMVACRHPLSLSFSVVLSSHLWLFLSLSLSPIFSFSLALSFSRARALALSRRLIYSCALEGTIDTPTCWNGVLQSPSVIVSSHLWLFLSFSLISLVSLSCARSRTRARPRH